MQSSSSRHYLSDDSNAFSTHSFDSSLGEYSFGPGGTSPAAVGSSAFTTSLRRSTSISEEIKLVERPSLMDRNKDRLKDFTIDKLKIDSTSIGLIGREKEVSILKDVLKRITTKEESGITREVVAIGGYSGVGKTSLAKSIQQDVVKERAGMFVEGKFDQNIADEPYSGIAQAFGEICQRILELDDHDQISEIAKSIVDNLGDDVVLLMHLIPELEGVLTAANDDFNPEMDIDFDIFNIQNGLDQWKFALRILTRILCSHFAPLVLLLDDFQWADTSSIDALDYMISDVENPNPLLIQVCYRSNEVDDDGMFKRKLKAMEEKTKTFQFKMTHIDLECCNEDDVNEIVKNMMSMDDADATRSLAKVCFKRTLGNPFFLMEFMVMLKEEGLLTFNLGLVKWVWKAEEIKNATMSTTNVVALLQTRMRKLEDHVQRFIQYAACLGASFQVTILRIVWEKHFFRAMLANVESIDKCLSVMQAENLIEPNGIDGFRWVHDKVQEAALFLSSDGIDALKFEIGTTLFVSLNENELDEHLFDVVDLVNKGTESGNTDFAQLNHRAAKKARDVSGYHSAAKYVERGLWQLKDAQLEANREMLLGLHTIGVEVEIPLGNGDKAEEYSKAIVSRDDFTIMEKLPIKIAMLGKMCYIDMEFDRAIDESLKVLKSLGYSMIWSKRAIPIQAIHCLMGTMNLAKKGPGLEARCEGLGPMTDPKHKALLELVAAICYAAYMAERTFLNVIGISKMIELTLAYGVGENTGMGFSGFGMLMIAVRQDFDLAKEFTDAGLGLRKVAPMRDGATMFNAYTLTLPWKMPLAACVEKLNRAYILSMRAGDSPYAMWSLMGFTIWTPYIIGKGLLPIIKETPKVLAQAEELRQVEHEKILKMVYQMMFNLASTGATSELEGDVFSARNFTDKNPILVAMVHFAEGELLIFSDIGAAANRAVKHGDKLSKLSPAVSMIMIETFHRGVALYAMARRTKKRAYKSKASKIRKTIEKWREAGNPNVGHYLRFLSAEHAALGKKKQEADKLYVESITLAARTGHLHHAGLLNERYADFLAHDMDRKDEAMHRIGKAIEYYREWGAMGKVEMLEKQLENGSIQI